MDINLTKEIESVVTDLKSNLFKMVKELDKKIRQKLAPKSIILKWSFQKVQQQQQHQQQHIQQ